MGKTGDLYGASSFVCLQSCDPDDVQNPDGEQEVKRSNGRDGETSALHQRRHYYRQLTSNVCSDFLPSPRLLKH